jgi:hypothetical protein
MQSLETNNFISGKPGFLGDVIERGGGMAEGDEGDYFLRTGGQGGSSDFLL